MSPSSPSTRTTLLHLATERVQLVGYNAFSYRDLAASAGITTASVHYHFPTKGDLALAMVQRQRELDRAIFSRLDVDVPDAWRRLQAFCAALRRDLENGHRMCLCGMLAAEHATLPAATVEAIRGFFSDTEAWLAAVLLEGRRAGVVAFAGPAGTVAQALLSAVEGAMLTARAFGDLGRFDAAVKWHLARLKP